MTVFQTRVLETSLVRLCHALCPFHRFHCLQVLRSFHRIFHLLGLLRVFHQEQGHSILGGHWLIYYCKEIFEIPEVERLRGREPLAYSTSFVTSLPNVTLAVLFENRI
jgi:hypothetical protein